MKTLVALVLVVLIALPMPAQDHAAKPTALPELQEWYSWSGALSPLISYLPNFSANGGANAVTQGRASDPTWFNRFPFDTSSQFSWQQDGSHSVTQVDFNNDGLPEYFDYKGRIYTTVFHGAMPLPEPVFVAPKGGYEKIAVADFNGDGFTDLFVPQGAVTFQMIFGGADLKRLKVTGGEYPVRQTFIAAYRTSSGKGRVLSYQKEDFVERFVLYGLEVTATGDSIQVSLRELDKIEKGKPDKSKQLFEPLYTTLYQSRVYQHRLMLTHEYSVGRVGYDISADTFNFLGNAPLGTMHYSSLNGSIDGDDKEDFAIVGGWKKGNDIINGYFLLSGNPMNGMDSVIGFFPCYNCDDLAVSIVSVGDVNGDGVNDIGVSDGTSAGYFRIFLGIRKGVTGVKNSDNYLDFTLFQSEPNPVGDDGKAVLPLSLSRAGAYTLALYDTGGRKIADLFVGELPAGKQRLPLNLTPYSLGSGLYVVRLSDGKATAERAIMIQR